MLDFFCRSVYTYLCKQISFTGGKQYDERVLYYKEGAVGIWRTPRVLFGKRIYQRYQAGKDI